MKTHNRFTVTTIAIAFVVCNGFSALAQTSPYPAVPPTGTLTPGIPRMSPLFTSPIGMNAGITDPSQTSISILSARPDVRSELRISSRQREALDNLQLQARQQAQARIQDNLQQRRAQMQLNRNNPMQPTLTPEERRAQMLQQQQDLQQAMDTSRGNMEKSLATILRPEQMQRLSQLDLQWRGPLASTDPRVADALQLTPEQRTYIAQQFQQYLVGQQQLLLAATNAARGVPSPQNGPNNSGGVSAPNASGSQRNGALQDAQLFQGYSYPRDAALMMEKLRKASAAQKKAAEQKVVAALSPEQWQQWQVLEGAKFAFRTNF